MMSAIYLQDNIIEFEIVFLDPDNNNAPVDPTVVTFQFWFSPDGVTPPLPAGSVITYTGATVSAVNVISRVLNSDGIYCYRCRIDTTSIVISPGASYGTGVGKWKSTGVGQGADNDYVQVEPN